jgi:two-component system, OmpR family, KDP operon response regulator KdpE
LQRHYRSSWRSDQRSINRWRDDLSVPATFHESDEPTQHFPATAGGGVMTTGARILVIDDEAPIRRWLKVNLETRGYTVDTAETGEQGIKALENRRPDLLILDLLMPGMGGIDVVRKLRSVSTIPIIVLSAIGEEAQKVQALELGADDYMTKPFGMEELFARIRSLLRRAAGATSAAPVFVAGDLSVDFDRREVRLDGQPIKLTPTEYDLLKYMIEHAGKVLTHRMLLQEVWGQAYIDQAQYLRVFVGQLRKKIEKHPGRPRFILTDPGVGYRFCSDTDD